MDSRPARRDVLRLSAAAILGGVLSACTGGGSNPAPSATTSVTSSPSATGTSAPRSKTPPPPTSASTSASTAASTASSSRASTPTFSALTSQVSGGVVRKGQSGYRPADLLYNPRFQSQPAPQAIARCRTSDDVAACVRFAAAGGAPLRIRNGGHSYGGWSSGPGLVADLALLSGVQVNAHAGTATVGAGARLADVYSALAARGVSIGAGSCPTVGVTGLTLGGGVGVLARTYGLTCDQVRSFDVVTADGRKRSVDADHDADLFWALRGGGGSFAAVTALTFAVRPAPTIDRFFLQWPWSAAATVLAAWQQWIAAAPRELWSTCKLLADPGTGRKVTVSGTWTGSGSADARLRALLTATPKPSTDFRTSAGYGPTMFGEAGCAGQDAETCVANALAPAQRQPFAATSSIVSKPLPEAGVAAIVAAVGAGLGVAKVVEAGASFDSLGGAIADVGPAATAFPWRHALAAVQYTATWAHADAAVDPAPFDALVRSQRRALTPWLGTSAYVNYADPAIADYATAYWSTNAARLSTVKRAYDPDNVFSFPQSVPL